MDCQESLSTSTDPLWSLDSNNTRSLCLSDGQSKSLSVNTDDWSQECDRFFF